MAPFSSDAVEKRESTVSARVVKEIAAAVERAGISREQFLRATTLAPELIDGPDGRLTRSEIYACCEVAFDLTGDPALGLHWGEWITANSFALMSQLQAHAGTLRRAFELLFQFGDLVADEVRISMIERNRDVEVHFGGIVVESLRLQRMAAEVAMLGLFRMIRDFSPLANLTQVDFPYPAPSYRDEYTRLFEGSERFDQPHTCLRFDCALLDLPSPHRDEDVQRMLQALAERRVAALRQRVPFAVRVREVLLRENAPHRVPMSDVAEQLHVSLRSLHRRLTDEGQSYTTLANEASGLVAKRLLTEEGRTIQDASSVMGFADASSFHRAFKRWTGTTPTKFRSCR